MSAINSNRNRIIAVVAVLIIVLAGGSFELYQNYQENKTHPSEPCYSDSTKCNVTKQDVLQMAIDRGIKDATLKDIEIDRGGNGWSWRFFKEHEDGSCEYGYVDVFTVDPDSGQIMYQYSDCQQMGYISNINNHKKHSDSQVQSMDAIYAVDLSNDQILAGARKISLLEK